MLQVLALMLKRFDYQYFTKKINDNFRAKNNGQPK